MLLGPLVAVFVVFSMKIARSFEFMDFLLDTQALFYCRKQETRRLNAGC